MNRTGWISRATASVLGLMALAGCVSDETREGMVGYVEGFYGGVVADEPQAALIGRDILAAGGSAADAAVAVYFALSVTLPSSASLGGGGVCLVQDGREETRKETRKFVREKVNTTQVLDFLPRPTASVPAGATRPTAVPGNARGFFALHSKYGRMRWSRLVAPAETLARFGYQVPRVLAREVAAIGPALLQDPAVRRVFAGKDGEAVGERDFLVQTELSGVLAAIRAKGPGDLYSGALARQLVEGTVAAGGSLSLDDLRDFHPQWRDSVKVPVGDWVAHFAAPPVAAGTTAAQIFAMARDADFDGADAVGRQHLLAEASERAFADRGQWMAADGSSRVAAADLVAPARIKGMLASYRAGRHTPAASLSPAPVARPENPAATGFVAVDREGSAVACVVTLNNLFGTGRMARGTGIILAAAPDSGGRGFSALSPMMVVNHNIDDFVMAATATGGVTAPTSLASVASRVLLAEEPLEESLAAKRTHHGGAPDTVYYEQGVPDAVISGLAARGQATAPTPVLGLVNAISCPDGLPSVSKSCSARTDPRGFGLAVAADEQ